MEFLRFGSSIPGSYWGCCAGDIVQNFKVDPDAKASIQLVNGDGGQPQLIDGKFSFVGGTYRDIFKNRIRIGTFNLQDMPNHFFIAVLTHSQIATKGSIGHKWLEILKEEGFEFIRTVDNSVYTGNEVVKEVGEKSDVSSHPNYVFALFRNIGKGRIEDQFTPPKAWTDLPVVVKEVNDVLTSEAKAEMQASQETYALERWNAGKTVFVNEATLEKNGVPVTYAGIRSEDKQELKSVREARNKAKADRAKAAGTPDKVADPFAIDVV